MITQEELRRLFSYDPESGSFKRLVRRGRCKEGEIAGGKRQGYIILNIGLKTYQAHRLAWLYFYGEWPKDQLDHINGIRSDNRIVNLRPVTNSENLQNLRSARCDNKSGFLGVTPITGKWIARIMVNGKSTYLGYFQTPELAHNAYLIAKRKLHSTCTI